MGRTLDQRAVWREDATGAHVTSVADVSGLPVPSLPYEWQFAELTCCRGCVWLAAGARSSASSNFLLLRLRLKGCTTLDQPTGELARCCNKILTSKQR